MMDDIMKLLNEMEERRQQEREEDKRERKAVADEIKEGVKKEMQESMKPWQERTIRVEESTAEMREEVKRLAIELREIKEQVVTGLKKQSYASAAGRNGASCSSPTGANTVLISNTVSTKEDLEEKARIASLLSSGSKVIGLKPIDKRHVEHVKRRLEDIVDETEVQRDERAKKGAVNLFLKHEMRMKDEDIEELDIVKIFSPAKDEWNTLYVELATWEMAKFLTSFTTYMRRNTAGEDRVEVIKYIPRDLFTRYKAVNAFGNKLRLESNNTMSFRVNFGREDFVLQQKPLSLPANLPPFEHHLPRSARSPGEALGRPALTPEKARKRDRQTPSPSGTTPEEDL